tara:strand:- start:640 stop:981 length:342 start_codon:yes stop_codon:yes gene_type:complete
MGWIANLKRGVPAAASETLFATGTCSLDTQVTLCGSSGSISVTIPDASDDRIGMRKVFVQTGTGGAQITPSTSIDTGTSDICTITGEGAIVEFMWTKSGWALFGDQDVDAVDS